MKKVFQKLNLPDTTYEFSFLAMFSCYIKKLHMQKLHIFPSCSRASLQDPKVSVTGVLPPHKFAYPPFCYYLL
jgi:hypothetical protein